MAALEWEASLPPFSRSPFPLAKANADICGMESGLDSKIIMSTPMETVTWESSRPSLSSLRLLTTPSGSGLLAMWRKPAASVASFASVSFSRVRRTFATPFFSAASTSIAFSAISSSFRSSKASAMVFRIFFRTSKGIAQSFRASALAATALLRASSETDSTLRHPLARSAMACFSRSLPGVAKRVPGDLNLESRPRTPRMLLRSDPEATTHALQFVPGATAAVAASILLLMPPRPPLLLAPINTESLPCWYTGNNLAFLFSFGDESKTPSTSVSKSRTSAPKLLAHKAARESLSENTSSAVYPRLAETASFSLMMGTIPRLSNLSTA
mmetsp:Transcript_28365/g.65799  ORF Transcript_28365/g.65799 Transcript_28365/m.65799 type:complete len:328 (+) Transcript_28365:1235-2218(+)